MKRPWVVLKFGGTSVSSLARWQTIAEVARRCIERGERPLLVCSALAGITNELEALPAEAVDGRHEARLRRVRERHLDLAEELGLDGPAVLGEELELLGRLLLGISLLREASPKQQARILSFGELMATRLGAAFLKAHWLDARRLLRSEEEPNAGEARRFLSAACAHDPDPALQSQLEALEAPLLITQGFIAQNSEGDTVLLGRGGSDTSAAYFAAKLRAACCEIWTDVPGMYSADPRQVPTARLLRLLDYDEAQEIASTGAKVLHPRCLAPLRRLGIPLQVRCTQRPEAQGTTIASQADADGAQVKAISARLGITLISMDTVGMWQQVGFLADAFACFKRHGVSIDLVSTSESNVTVSLDPVANALDPQVIQALLKDLGLVCRARTIGPCASVSLVGRNIRAILHQLGPALELFEEHKIHLVSQAASDLNLTFVVDEEQAERLVRRLHGLLFQHRQKDALFGPTWQETFERPIQAPQEAELAPPALWWKARRAELLELARERSPIYVYDEETLRARARQILELPEISRALFAVKSNANPEALAVFEELGMGFECVSPGELRHVLTCFPDLDPRRILFTPNFAPRSEYEEAFERGVLVTLDNLHPLQFWGDAFAGREIFVRLDPGEGRGHHAHVRTAGAHSKFGISRAQLGELHDLAARWDVRVVGLHAHKGSGIRSSETWSRTALALAEAAERFPQARVLDLGGGLGVVEKPGQLGLDLAALGASLIQFKAAYPEYSLWLEPGRFLVAEAGVLLARVTQLKDKGDIHYVGIDAGMNSLIRPALYGAYHEIVNLSRLEERPSQISSVVGPICESGDTFGYARALAPCSEGDVLLIATAGAYGRTMSSNYNLREPAEEHLLRQARVPSE